jgi:FkbM family methyltransferase
MTAPKGPKMTLARRALRVARQEGLSGVMLRLRGKWAAARVPLLRAMGRPVVPSAYGIKLAANWADATFGYYVAGVYGRSLSDLIAGMDRPFHFLDIGANQGLYAILAARNPLCRGVHAFEPVPDTAALLRQNLALNGVAGRVTVVEAAITDRQGVMLIHLPQNHSGGATLRAATTAQGARAVEIATTDAEGLGDLAIPDGLPILIKIDVEGHEATVLQQVLQSRHVAAVTAIFYECDETWVDAAAIEAQLRAAGFRSFAQIGSGTHYDVLARRDAA